jgi:hypothetical protein
LKTNDLKLLKLLQTESQQRFISEYEVPKDTRVLQEVEIKASKIQETDRVSRPYGRPDYVLTDKDLNTATGNLLNTILGKVSGMRYHDYVDASGRPRKRIAFSRTIGLTGAWASVTSSEPLVTINDVPVGGRPAGEILEELDPNTVQSIEITKRINVLYGSQGVNGVIAIYTKTGVKSKANIGSAKYISVQGFSNPREFTFPDYNKQVKDNSTTDFRSIIYWDPNLIVSESPATVSFFTSDLETTYRVVVEGVTEKNEPVRATYFIHAENE